MIIRQATIEDLPQIQTLEQQTDTAAHWSARDYEILFAATAPPRVALVAVDDEDDRHVYGFAIARSGLDEWEIENVVVDSHHRRQGLACAMVAELLCAAKSAAALAVLLEVRESNVAARQLYEKSGFTQVGRRSDYYQHPAEDALLLRFSITVP